jgi:predicted aldo/keto reductase-like oxidoreductase
MTILKANVAAAVNRSDFSGRDTELLHRLARETHSDYCAGCAKICESAIETDVPIGDVMRYLMYYRSCGEYDYAATQFKAIPETIRLQMASSDYSSAEQRCPQNMPIGKLMKEAVDVFHL